MKKYVVIIGLVLAALVFGSCGQKGGTIKVTNMSADYPVDVYITKKVATGTPPSDYVDKKTIAKGGTGQFSIKDDGTYYINPFYTTTTINPATGSAVSATLPGMTDPVTATAAILLAGNSVSVKVKQVIH